MLEAEANSYKAKAEMDKKMSLPMFGIGLQYSIMAKNSEEMARMSGMSNMNGMDMVMPMIKISIPIFRRKYNAQQRESRHYREASELKYEDTLNQLHAEYIALKQQLADASRKIDLYAKQQDLSRSTYQLMIREFSAGTTSSRTSSNWNASCWITALKERSGCRIQHADRGLREISINLRK